MAIVATDLKFLSSERMTDSISPIASTAGGGHAAAPVVQDGVASNIFPNVSPGDRTTGRRQLRLVYPAVLSNENSRASNFAPVLSGRPTDAGVEICALRPADFVSSAGLTTQEYDRVIRSAYHLAGALDGGAFMTLGTGANATASGTAGDLTGYTPGVVAPVQTLGTVLAVGDKVLAVSSAFTARWRTVTAVNAGAGTLTLSGTFGWAGGAAVTVYKLIPGLRVVSAPSLLTVALSAAGQNATVDRLDVRMLPTGASATTPGIFSAEAISGGLWANDGLCPIFFPGRRVLLQHPTMPATREVRLVESVNYATGVVRFTTGVTNAYPIGTRVATLLEHGEVQGAVSLSPFFQSAWANAWADVASGGTISARYNGAVGMNNAGSIKDRWAIVFTSATQFNLISERFGQVASGNTGSDFQPLNPLTNQPYMTLYAASWTTGWLPGYTMRLNTEGAHSPTWLCRCISPSAAAGTVNGVLAIRADVDA